MNLLTSSAEALTQLRRSRASNRITFPATARIVVLVACLSIFSGCQPTVTPEEQPANGTAASPPKASTVPLRILVVGELTNPEIVERRWLAESEQPIKLSTQEVGELLSAEECAADVVLFPAHLLGELVARDWVLKLPELPNTTAAGITQDAPTDEDRRSASAAAAASSRYSGDVFGMPLGCSVPQLIASDSLVSQLSLQSASAGSGQDPTVDGSQLRDWLTKHYAAGNEEVPATSERQEFSVDAEAVVDRFLSLMVLISERDPLYGILFDIETMKPRFASADGVQAIELMTLLARQPGGMASVLGNHDAAWTWAVKHEQPVVAIASTTMLSADARQGSGGQELRLAPDKYVNAGRGMLVGLAADCRQTLQSLIFIQWLSRPSTTQVLVPIVRGVDPAQPLSVDATAWRLRQNLVQTLASDRVPQEPRFPHAHQLREILAEAIVACVRDGSNIESTLASAEEKWQAPMTSDERATFKRTYKTSLGLREF